MSESEIKTGVVAYLKCSVAPHLVVGQADGNGMDGKFHVHWFWQGEIKTTLVHKDELTTVKPSF